MTAEVLASGVVARRWLLTERDVEWLAWVGRWRFVSAGQLSREFGRRGLSAPVKVVERRLRAMRELGLVSSERVVADVPAVHSLTRDGMRVVGLSGPVVGPKLAEFRHDLAVTDLACELLLQKPGHRLVTEREVRHAETPNQLARETSVGVVRRWSVVLPEKRFGGVYPDLVTETPSGAVWAHELEASRKEHRRLVRLMLAYARASYVRGVKYYAVESVLAGVKKAALEANALSASEGLPARVDVEGWPLLSTSAAGAAASKEGAL